MSDSTKIRIGVLGAARCATYVIFETAQKRDDCEIVALGCRDAVRGRTYLAENGCPDAEVKEDYLAIVERDDVDLIYNALPPSRHADLSIAALKAGKPVLCEKPFAMNAQEARRMTETASNTGVPLIEAFHYRFHPAFDRLLDIIHSGRIGDVTHMDAIFVAPVPFQPDEIRHTLEIGGGTLMDMGCYPVHWSRMVMGAEPVITEAICETSAPDIDCTTRATLEFPGGAVSRIECSMRDDRIFQAELNVYGDKGKIYFANPLAPQRGHAILIHEGEHVSIEQCEPISTYDLQLAHTLSVVRGEAEPITGGHDAVATMHVIDTIYEKAGLARRPSYPG